MMKSLVKLKRFWLAVGVALGLNNADGITAFLHRVVLALADR